MRFDLDKSLCVALSIKIKSLPIYLKLLDKVKKHQFKIKNGG